MELNKSEIVILKEFIEWYEWSGYDALDIFDDIDKVIKEYLNHKYA